MANVVIFKPKHHLTATQNMADFVTLCRDQLTVLGDVVWDSDTWDITDHTQSASGHTTSRCRISFTMTNRGDPFFSPFADFARAYFRYSFALSQANDYRRNLYGLRALAIAMGQFGESDPTRLTPEIFNLAAAHIKETASRPHAYSLGSVLAKVAAFLSEHRLVGVPFQWINPNPPPKNARARIGTEGEEARARAMPTKAALDALPVCFRRATTAIDVLVTSVLALLCTSPSRIGEVFSLRADCEVIAVYDGCERYGIAWWPEKGADPMVKWIPATMADIAKEAIRRLRDISAPARAIAVWYCKHPDRVYLPPGTEHLRDRQYLTTDDISAITGLDDHTHVTRWCQANRIRLEPQAGRQIGPNPTLHIARFTEVQVAVLAGLPPGFPIADPRTGLTYDQALLLMRRSDLGTSRSNLACKILVPDYQQIIAHLVGPRGATTIFQRFGLAEPDGSPIHLRTHQLRHWLNTLAHRSGLSQIDIAKWSGRSDIRQNHHYDHMTGEEILSMVREVTSGDESLFGSSGAAANAPITHAEVACAVFPTAHVTDLGVCFHDFSMLPCLHHRDCLNCTEHACIKGDAAKAERLRSRLYEAERLLQSSKSAIDDGDVGADRWLEHQHATTERLRQILSIMDDPTVPIGTVIRLTTATPILPSPPNLDEMRGILGAML